MPNATIIAGPNGAGKTTYARRFLPDELRLAEFVNADLIAAGLSPFNPDKAAFQAGRIMLRRLRDLVAARADFSFETTLTGRTYLPLLQEMRKLGYFIRLDFLWIPDLDVTRQRVHQRVAKGGHDIPDPVQQRRFRVGVRNLATVYRPWLDQWRLFDNTSQVPRLVAGEMGACLTVADAAALAWIEKNANIRFMAQDAGDQVEEPAVHMPDENTRAAIRALRKAFADAVLENLRWGLPVILMRDGKVAQVPAEELAPRARRILAANGEPLPEDAEFYVGQY